MYCGLVTPGKMFSVYLARLSARRPGWTAVEGAQGRVMGSAVVPSGHLDRSPMRPRAARSRAAFLGGGPYWSRSRTMPASAALRPAVVQRKVTDNDRAMWA